MSKKKNVTVQVNSEIREVLTKLQIPVHDGLSVLVSIYYGLQPSFVPDLLMKKISSSEIFTINYETLELEWKIPLFEETEIGFEWIGEWMDLFKQVNPARRGSKRDCLSRMKKFFVNNPSIRKQDVFEATKQYLKTVSDPKFCKLSHKFISEIDGTSMLYNFVIAAEERKDIFDDEMI